MTPRVAFGHTEARVHAECAGVGPSNYAECVETEEFLASAVWHRVCHRCAHMAKIIGLTFVLLTGALVALGWATERTDRFIVAKSDAIVFGDGTTLWASDDTRVEGLQEGVKVKLSYEELAGRHVVTSVEAAE